MRQFYCEVDGFSLIGGFSPIGGFPLLPYRTPSPLKQCCCYDTMQTSSRNMPAVRRTYNALWRTPYGVSRLPVSTLWFDRGVAMHDGKVLLELYMHLSHSTNYTIWGTNEVYIYF